MVMTGEQEVKMEMNMTKNSRFIKGLRAAGWTEKEINDFMLYIESGEEEYMPNPREQKEN